MKILKIIHGYPPLYNAGSEVYSQSVCDELSKGHSVYIFSREENPYLPDFSIREEVLNKNLKLFLINMPLGKDGFRHKLVDEQFKSILLRFKPDIAHIGHLNHLSTGIVDVLHEFEIPIVYTLHDFWLMCPRGQFLQRNFDGDCHLQLCDKQEDRKCATNCYKMYFTGVDDQDESETQYWTRWMSERMKETKRICELVDVFIAPSQYLRNRFINDFEIPEEKISYLDYGFPTHYLKPVTHKAESEAYVFGYIGTHIPAKGVNLILEALKEIKRPAKLFIWGHKDPQSSRTLLAMVKEWNLPVEFKGEYINKNLAEEVFSNVDCIIVPSIWTENSPLVIHEAQACRIPVITANIGGMAEYIEHKVNGLLFEHRNHLSLSEKMQWAMQNKLEMQHFGNHGYLLHPQGDVPSIETHCEHLLNIYTTLKSPAYAE